MVGTENQVSFSVDVKVALARRKMSVRELAAEIGKTRETTSRAIHKGMFPAVRELITKFLKL